MTELAMNPCGELEPVFREAGLNDSGMVVWDVDMRTPEYPKGRRLILLANDITYNIGSFGPIEDEVFLKASLLARMNGIPRIHISANSGARIGLADELSSIFKIAWINSEDESKGIKYLYLDQNGYDKYVVRQGESVVKVEKVNEDGEVRYKIIHIIGELDGLGVENLSGSGLIAGETSRAYKDIFTLTVVSCRSVGIGAYLVRLGQRTIQVKYMPIILTGANALNKVLGREVYTSNLQLGGSQIMFKNGVSHLIANNDLDALQQTLEWLSFVPEKKGACLPTLLSGDPIDREIGVDLLTSPYDVRDLIRGVYDSNRCWNSGFFDENSFTETLAGWAQGVVVGRARLGGKPNDTSS